MEDFKNRYVSSGSTKRRQVITFFPFDWFMQFLHSVGKKYVKYSRLLSAMYCRLSLGSKFNRRRKSCNLDFKPSLYQEGKIPHLWYKKIMHFSPPVPVPIPYLAHNLLVFGAMVYSTQKIYSLNRIIKLPAEQIDYYCQNSWQNAVNSCFMNLVSHSTTKYLHFCSSLQYQFIFILLNSCLQLLYISRCRNICISHNLGSSAQKLVTDEGSVKCPPSLNKLSLLFI